MSVSIFRRLHLGKTVLCISAYMLSLSISAMQSDQDQNQNQCGQTTQQCDYSQNDCGQTAQQCDYDQQDCGQTAQQCDYDQKPTEQCGCPQDQDQQCDHEDQNDQCEDQDTPIDDGNHGKDKKKAKKSKWVSKTKTVQNDDQCTTREGLFSNHAWAANYPWLSQVKTKMTGDSYKAQDLEFYHFVRPHYKQAEFERALIQQSVFGQEGVRTVFDNECLHRSDFEHATFNNVIFYNVDFKHGKWSGANFIDDAYFYKCNFTEHGPLRGSHIRPRGFDALFVDKTVACRLRKLKNFTGSLLDLYGKLRTYKK